MADNLTRQMHNGQGDFVKLFQQTFRRRIVNALLRVVLDQAGQLLLFLLQFAADDKFDQRQQPRRNAQKIGQTHHLVGAWLTVSPLANTLGFVALPPLYWLLLAGLLVCYVILTQLVKTWFYRKFGT